MKTNELRVGNYIEHNSEWCYRGEDVSIFQWSESDWYALGECTMLIENLLPIELTEEWLVKFGWGIDEDFESSFLDNTSLKHEVLFYNTSSRVLSIESSKDIIELKHIHHVHQLQNLYFALKGEELKIELP